MSWLAYPFIAIVTTLELVVLVYAIRWLVRNYRPATHADIYRFYKDGGGAE